MNEKDIDKHIEAIQGKSKADAMDYLVPKIGYKEAEKFWAKEGATSKKQGFRELFYDKLREGDMDKAEVKAFAEEHGSPNDAKQFTHYVTIAELVKDTRK